jgi:RNA polymerase sigma-70 factor (ECF subfamily)
MTEVMRNGRKGQKHGTNRRRTGLFLRVREGESHLFGVLVEELSDLLCRRLRSNARTRSLDHNPADVEDVLQETFLRLWEHRDRFDARRGAIEGWAWVMARNDAVDVLRRRSRPLPASTWLEAAEDPRADEPGDALVAAEERQVLAEALARETNPKVRRVLELRLVAGLPYAAVSQATGVPAGTVATWVHRLARSLRVSRHRSG